MTSITWKGNACVQSERSNSYSEAGTSELKKYLYGGINTYTVEEDRLQGYGQTAFDAASRLPSVTITNGSEIHIRNNSEPAIIVIDDIVYEDASDILKDIQVSDMSSISLLRGADAVILGPRASGGAVVITLKDLEIFRPDQRKELSLIHRWDTVSP